jgi:DNA-directed RNA polymerase subunit RPC12/RpoP
LPHRLLKKDQCFYCFGSPKRTIESIKSELLEKKLPFEYVDTEYKGNKKPVSFKCKKCNKVFKARPNDILSTNQKECPHCSKRKISKAESIIKNILIKENIEFISQRTFKDLTVQSLKRKSRLKFDFSIILNNQEILLEYDGAQHFYATGRFTEEDVLKNHERDILKNDYCIKNKIPLMRITFKDYNNLTKIIKKLLSSTTIPDECKVVDPSGSKDSAALWEQYHSADDIV